jgi:hypothetical protein
MINVLRGRITVRGLLLALAVAVMVVAGVGVSAGRAVAGDGRVPSGTVVNVVKPKPDARETGMCDVLAQLGAYTYRYGGALVRVPDGRALLTELSADGVKGKQRQAACKALVGEYASHN